MPKRSLTAADFKKRRALLLPTEARYDTLLGLRLAAHTTIYRRGKGICRKAHLPTRLAAKRERKLRRRGVRFEDAFAYSE